MKILLINPPEDLDFSLFVLEDYNSKARSHAVPLWALYLHAYIKDSHECKIIDMAAKGMQISDIDAELDSFKPDFVGLTCVIGRWKTVRKLSERIKNHSDIKVILGGVNPSLYPWETLQCPHVDYVIEGFGQRPLKELLDKYPKQKVEFGIPKLHTKYNCTKETVGCFNFENVDDFPMPDRSILPIEDYVMPFFGEEGNPVTSSVTSFGCPFKCRFCRSKEFKPLILRDPDKIAAEMKNIENIGIKGVIFNDELLTLNTKRIGAITSALIRANVNLKLALRSRANLVNADALNMLKDAGVFSIHMGIESGTDRILGEMNKQLTVETIKKSVGMIKEAGLKVSASFMLGYKDESESEIMQTIQFSKDLDLDNSQYFIVQPEPETELYQELKYRKGLPDDIYRAFTLDPDSVDLKNNLASTRFDKEVMNEILKYAYSQTKNLYSIKEEYESKEK